jgi:Tfp pilus assembly protein PilN
MNAINLIPADERRAASVGRSGGAVYALIGVLGVFVVLATAYALTARSVTSKRTQLAEVTRHAEQAEAQARQFERYTEFATLRQKRSDTVRSLAQARFDWGHVLREVSRTIPPGVLLSSLTGTTGAGGAASPSTMTGASGAPSVAIDGCTSGQEEVADLMVSLRRIDGVARVTLSSSTRDSDSSASGTSSACPMKFSMNLTFSAPSQGGTSNATGSAKGVTP